MRAKHDAGVDVLNSFKEKTKTTRLQFVIDVPKSGGENSERKKGEKEERGTVVRKRLGHNKKQSEERRD